MEALLKKYKILINAIGHNELLNLCETDKTALKNAETLIDEVNVLEAIYTKKKRGDK